MTSKLYADWLALSQSSLSLSHQLLASAQAGMQTGLGNAPDASAQSAQLARALKSSLEIGAQWKALQADAVSALLHQQLSAFKAQRDSLGLSDLMALHQSVKHDLAAQQQALAETLSARTDTCLDDLARADSKDDLAIVAAGFLKDLGSTLGESAQQGFTVLNAASAAVTVLTHQALDRTIAGAPPA